MGNTVHRRAELQTAHLSLGRLDIDLESYATTGLRVVAIGPSGIGKTSVGLLIAEQLSAQGWVSVIVDPEGEIEALYGKAITDPAALMVSLEKRLTPIVVVAAHDPAAFIPFGEVILEAADRFRKPIFLMIDEGQMFSAPRKRQHDMGASSDLLNEAVTRGRKRCLDFFITATRFSGSLHRSVFGNKNLTLIGSQEDPTTWSGLAPQFRGTGIGFNELTALEPGQFFCRSKRGVEKVTVPMARALAQVAPKAKSAKPALPTTFSQWDRALRAIPTERLRKLEPRVVGFLSTVAGLTAQQIASGNRAIRDELEART